MKKYNFIIVGGGLAGKTLAYFLVQSRKTVLLIDENRELTSSKIAAGIIHPVTGRRIVKTWMADELIPFAQTFYNSLERKYNRKLFHPIPVLEIFSSIKSKNDWMMRSSEQGFENYFAGEITSGIFSELLHCDFGGMLLNNTGYLDITSYLKCIEEEIPAPSAILEDKFSFEDFTVNESFVRWKNNEASKIIFCEGYNCIHNPFFKHLPFLPAKGEILQLFCEKLPEEFILNHGMFVLPLGNHLFKAGSTYEWDFKDTLPSEEGKNKIKKFLDDFLKVNYEIILHEAAVRPTIQDRRPVIGLHSQYPSIGIFNGLGTKGVLLAPLFAKQFAGFLCGKDKIHPEADVNRFNA